jgi:catechol 2,3-dioxygenase-like lactoylglutathione lyase family enzyme
MTRISRLLETALYVDDVERSCDFYQRVLGLGLADD